MIYFPRGTEMFHFPRLSLPALCVQAGVPCIAWRVSPFGYLRVKGCLRLTGASRRLLRPSSAPCPKASTVRPYQLEHHTHCTASIPQSPKRQRRGTPAVQLSTDNKADQQLSQPTIQHSQTKDTTHRSTKLDITSQKSNSIQQILSRQ